MRDLKTEGHLKHGQFKYTYHERIELSEIDIAGSLENPARLLKRVNEDIALNYGCAMEAGDEFPAIVLLKREAEKLLIATGVHRVKGAELARIDHFDAYIVVEPDLYRQELLIRLLNTWEGYGVSIQDRIAQVLLMHEEHPEKTLAHLSREFRLKEKTVKSYWYAETALKRGQRCGYDFTKAKLGKTVQVALNTIHSDVVFQRAAQFALTPGVTGNTVEDLVRDIRKAPREESAGLAVVDRYIHDATQARIQSQAKHGRVSPSAANKMVGNCKRVLRQIEGGMDGLHLAALADPLSALIVIEELMKNLKAVCMELERVRRLREDPRYGPQPPSPPLLH